MEVVSADLLAKKIVHEYFNVSKLDQDTQQDVLQYIRNFITDEQEKLMNKYETSEQKHKEDDTDSEDGSDTESHTSDEPEEEEDTVRVLTPYDMETVDIISVFLFVRELYESTVKTPGFVAFWNFYHTMFPSKN